MHFDGTDGSISLPDSSGLGKVATIIGNPQISTAQSKFGGASLYVNGDATSVANYVMIDGGAELSFEGDFTLDWWQYPVVFPDSYGGIFNVAWEQSGAVGLSWNSSGGQYHVNPGYPSSSFSAPAVQEWHHVAISRSGTFYRTFVDGAQVYEATSFTGTWGGAPACIGAGGPPGDNGDFNGYVDELRIVKGAAMWTVDFTPPTAPYPDP